MCIKMRPRLTGDQIKARLILMVGITLSFSFAGTIFVLLYGLLFVVQPLDQAPNDAEAWKILSPLTLTLGGALGGLLAANGLKGHPEQEKEKTSGE